MDWSEYASTLDKAMCTSNKRINNREDVNVQCFNDYESDFHHQLISIQL